MILVTGGTGLVGSHLLYDLTRSGKKVRVIKRAGSNVANVKKVFSYYTSDAETLLKNIEWVDADLLDIYSLLEAMENVTHVYHCAAMVSFEKKHEAEMTRINVDGTANMVNAALERRIAKFCHVSSIASLGRAEKGGVTSEETVWKASPDNSNYSITKYAAEREVWRATEEGLNTVIVNPSLIIGGGNWMQSSSNMFTKGYKGIRFYSEGTNGFVDVRDVVAIMIRLMESEISGQRFLLNGENASFRSYFDMIHEAFGKPKPSIKAGKFLTGVAWRADSIRSFLTGSPALITRETSISANRKSRFTSEKIKKVFPDYQFIPLSKSIADTCNLYLNDLKK